MIIAQFQTETYQMGLCKRKITHIRLVCLTAILIVGKLWISTIALSAEESWWKNDIVQNSIVYLLSLIVMVHKEIQKYQRSRRSGFFKCYISFDNDCSEHLSVQNRWWKNETSKRMAHLRQVRKRDKSRAVGRELNHKKWRIEYDLRFMQ